MGMRGPVPGPQRDLRSDIADLETDLARLARLYDHTRKSLCKACEHGICSEHQPSAGFINALRRNAEHKMRNIEAEVQEARTIARDLWFMVKDTEFEVNPNNFPDWLTENNED